MQPKRGLMIPIKCLKCPEFGVSLNVIIVVPNFITINPKDWSVYLFSTWFLYNSSDSL
jgi:hypothetical protein